MRLTAGGIRTLRRLGRNVPAGRRRASGTIPGLSLAGSAAAQVGPNIDKFARELANPGAANATLNFELEQRTFDGTLPGSGRQGNTTLTFQPAPPVEVVTRAAVLAPIREVW